MKNIHILGISGSLRADSTNTIILKTLGSLLPSDITFEIFEGLDEIQHFDPGHVDSDSVARFKSAIRKADAVVICTPEYAFGVPGTLKNALDWTVGTGDLNDKPVSVISASPLNSGGSHALASLLLTLTALGTRKNEASALSIPNVKSKLSAGEVSNQELIALLQAQCDNLLSLTRQ
ncbi:NAD(P)H-dependent oxidoreductase [Dyadobacter sp. CY261]|uniref:NADPH-dependent FMN reductase n=1 Tax=Dyadobacter sp. CY261 TaxID=2907203 RepID=UPI001F43C0CA|nr:NAD(P)H-dependent oxidoreductase [Dyadobacter sp. CY261]MCF0069951.1 NAD(P)H-dependent oxidoreductase [Dyadobacter sp. CY261]